MKRIYNGISIKYVQEPAEKQTIQVSWCSFDSDIHVSTIYKNLNLHFLHSFLAIGESLSTTEMKNIYCIFQTVWPRTKMPEYFRISIFICKFNWIMKT